MHALDFEQASIHPEQIELQDPDARGYQTACISPTRLLARWTKWSPHCPHCPRVMQRAQKPAVNARPYCGTTVLNSSVVEVLVKLKAVL